MDLDIFLYDDAYQHETCLDHFCPLIYITFPIMTYHSKYYKNRFQSYKIYDADTTCQ